MANKYTKPFLQQDNLDLSLVLCNPSYYGPSNLVMELIAGLISEIGYSDLIHPLQCLLKGNINKLRGLFLVPNKLEYLIADIPHFHHIVCWPSN